MASSVIFQKNNNDDFDRFPGFNIGNSIIQNTGVSKLDALMNRKKQQETTQEPVISETP